MSVDDKYTYPGSGGVLVNHYDIHDSVQLDRALNDIATAKWFAMKLEPVPAHFDVAHLQSVHRRLFEEILPFAGKLRDVDAQATGVGIPYCRPEFISEMARGIDVGLRADNYLRGMGHDAFAQRLAHHWGELTALHPMRDGNTRSQSAFVTQLAEGAGYSIEWKAVDVDRLRELRLYSVVGSSQPLGEYLSSRVTVALSGDGDAESRGPSDLTFEKVRKFANLDTPLRGSDLAATPRHPRDVDLGITIRGDDAGLGL